jgi:hypothetical protein
MTKIGSMFISPLADGNMKKKNSGKISEVTRVTKVKVITNVLSEDYPHN